MDAELKTAEPDSPRRCQQVTAQGQCRFEAPEGFKYCPIHNPKEKANAERERIRIYNLSKWQARLNQMEDHQQLLSLRSEIGILRITLENVLNKCQNDNELLLNSNRISDLALKIEKLVATCDRLENRDALSKTQLIEFASQIVNIITEHITDEAVLEKISKRVEALL